MWAVGVLLFGAVTALAGCSSTTRATTDHLVVIGEWDGANWMRDLAPQIGDRPLSQLMIPGTHDAGTFSIPATGARIADAQGDVGTAQLGITPDEFEIGTQITQSMTWTQQLEAGIRYFDFRVVCDPDGMFIVHTYRGQPILDALREIATWMAAHPTEVLLLDVQKNYGCATQSYAESGLTQLGNDALTAMVRAEFGAALAPRPASGDAMTTLNSLIAAGTNVVPFLIDTAYAESSDMWWLRAGNALPPGAGMTNVWEPIPTMPEMHARLVELGPSFAGRGASQLLLAALATSPMFPKDVGIANWYRDWQAGVQVGSLREFMTEMVLPSMPEMIAGAAAAGYGVLSTDFPELGQWPGGATFARLVVEQNVGAGSVALIGLPR